MQDNLANYLQHVPKLLNLSNKKSMEFLPLTGEDWESTKNMGEVCWRESVGCSNSLIGFTPTMYCSTCLPSNTGQNPFSRISLMASPSSGGSNPRTDSGVYSVPLRGSVK